jgi:hypothetical protein
VVWAWLSCWTAEHWLLVSVTVALPLAPPQTGINR